LAFWRPARESEESEKVDGGKRKRVRVVIADDSDEIRALLKLALERDGRLGLAGEAADGHQTLAVVAEERPELLLLDIAMPRLDGLQVLERLRAAHPDVKTVVYSAVGGERTRAAALDAGAADFVDKDTDPSLVVERLVALSR